MPSTVGSLSIPLARLGATVASSDISAAMTGEAAARAEVIIAFWEGVVIDFGALAEALVTHTFSNGELRVYLSL